ncbi:MAG TPA: chloride channel protein [Gemmatimonadaceae bacterium]|nr:chloride channel protein [Gemmatimonadaceae bacterium]
MRSSRENQIWRSLVNWFNGLELSENAILIAFSLAIGVLSALGVVGFYKSIDLAFSLFYRVPLELAPRFAGYAYRPVITAAGLAAAWWFMKYIGRGHDGMNVPDVQLAVVRRGGNIPPRPALARTLASALTIGAGGSAGSEGPVVVFGSAIGSLCGRTFGFSPDRMRVLVGAGAGAAISAAFNAPIAGAFFALEEILGSLAVTAFPPVVVASVIAAVISRAIFGNHPAFPIPVEYSYGQVREVFLFFPLLGVVTGAVAALFVRVFFGVESWVKRVPLPRWVIPWLGGALVGVLVVVSRGLLVGYGHLAVHLEVFGRMSWYTLALLALGSIIATSITLNAGGSGGLFTPSLYVGAATGGAFGVALAQLLPSASIRPEAYAIVGMGALVAASTHAPITGILLVFEMTNDYALVLPLMLATVISYLVAHRLEPDSLYSGWLRRRGERIEQGTDETTLSRLRVRDAYDDRARTMQERADVGQLLDHLGHDEQLVFPVVDTEGRLCGVIDIAALGRVAKDYGNLTSLVLATDLARPSETVTPNETLLDATRRMGIRGVSAVPVVDSKTGRVLGLLSRHHVLAAYERSIAGSPTNDESVKGDAAVDQGVV